MKILHLEDSDTDAELVREILTAEWPDCVITRAADRTSFERELPRGPFDAIVSDFTLPAFSGFDALQLAHATVPDTPFLFLSGAIGEDTAVAVMRTGASDYVMKDRMQRLAPAIAVALREAANRGQLRAAEQLVRHSAENYRILFEQSNDSICLAGPDARLIDVNPRACEMLGYTHAEFLGTRITDYIAPEDHARLRQELHLLSEVRARIGEYRFRRKDGTVFIGETSTTLLPDRRLLGFMRDITARKQSEAQLQEREARLHAIIESEPECVKLLDRDGNLLEMNPAGLRMLEADSLAQVQHQCVYPFVVEEHRPAFRALTERVLRGESGMLEFELIGLKGGRRTLETHATPLRDAAGAVTALLAVTRDITVHKQTEALIAGQKQVLEMIARGEPLGATLDALLRLIEAQVPDMLCSILLLDADGVHLRHGAAPSLPEAYTKAIDGTAIGPAVGSCGTAAHRSEPVFVEDIATDALWTDYKAVALPHGLRACWSTPIFDERRRVIGTFAIYYRQPGLPTARHQQLIEIATQTAAVCLHHHQAERRLREQAELLDRARDAIVVTDLDDCINFWSEGAEHLSGWPKTEVVGRPMNELLAPGQDERVATMRKLVSETGAWQGEIRVESKKGTPLELDLRVTLLRDAAGKPTGRLNIGTDITEKKKLEEQFLRVQRLESIGLLAAGIAHDLNNVLAPILMAAPLLRTRATDPGDVRMLHTLEKSAARGASLVRQILSFAHGSGEALRLTQTKHLLDDIIGVMRASFPKSIRFEEHVPNDLCPIQANPTQIHQILLNLCVNARDAMLPRGGTLSLRAENRALDQPAADALEAADPGLGARPGSWIVLEVADTGTGIPPEVLARIWEPFFTTKGESQGTGLGLSTVRGIALRHGGWVTVDTKVGHGTNFRVFLPAAEAGATPRQASASTIPFLAHGRGELILIADDESSIRDLAMAVLSRFGYRVLAAVNGREALEHYALRASDIALVITDFDMPEMGGRELAGAIARVNPAVPLIFMSGEPLPAGARLLNKPFTAEELLACVHKALEPAAEA